MSTTAIYLLFLLSLVAIPAPAIAAAPIRQQLTVTLDPDNHLITGESLTHYPDTPLPLSLSLAPHATIDDVSGELGKIPYKFNNGKLVIAPLPDNGKDLWLRVRYHAVYNDPLPSRFVSSEDPTYGVVGAITPEGAFLSGSAAWFPVAKGAEDLTITIISPQSWEAVTAGKCLVREEEAQVRRSVWDITDPLDEIPLSAGPYEPRFSQVGAIDIVTYFGDDNQGLSERYLGQTAMYLERYQKLFGKYPFPKFAVVENFFPTGYGFPSYTLIGKEILRLPFIATTSLPHEIAHSWWGNGVLVDYGTGNWSEGLATYVADHFAEEERSPQAAREYRGHILADYASLVGQGGGMPLRKFTSRVDASSRAVGYGKGAMVFHMLRTKLGDEHFYKALQAVYREHLFRQASWNDFTGAFSRVAGYDLSPFMSQWLERAGGPVFSVEKVSVKGGDKEGWRVSGVISQASPNYLLDLPIRVVTATGRQQKLLRIESRKTPFAFKTQERPLRIEVDPEADIFRILQPEEIPSSINRIKGSHSPVVVVTAGCRATPEILSQLMQMMGQKDAPLVTENGLKGDVAGRDLIFCGLPQKPVVSMPMPVKVGDNGFSVEGSSFSSPDNAVFTMVPHPFDAKRAAAIFLPLSFEAATTSIVKIPHYGKYGYVVFNKGSNVAKGFIPAAKDLTIVDLTQSIQEGEP